MDEILTKQNQPLSPEEREERSFIIGQMAKAQDLKGLCGGDYKERTIQLKVIKQESKDWYNAHGIQFKKGGREKWIR